MEVSWFSPRPLSPQCTLLLPDTDSEQRPSKQHVKGRVSLTCLGWALLHFIGIARNRGLIVSLGLVSETKGAIGLWLLTVNVSGLSCVDRVLPLELWEKGNAGWELCGLSSCRCFWRIAGIWCVLQGYYEGQRRQETWAGAFTVQASYWTVSANCGYSHQPACSRSRSTQCIGSSLPNSGSFCSRVLPLPGASNSSGGLCLQPAQGREGRWRITQEFYMVPVWKWPHHFCLLSIA